MRERTFNVLCYLAVFRLITVDLFHRRFGGRTLAASATSVRRLKEANRVQPQRLYGKRKCYIPTGHSVRLLLKKGVQVSRKAHLPIKPNVKAELYAVGCFCNETERSRRTLYRPSQDAERFPALARFAATHSDPLHKKRFVRDGDKLFYFMLDSGHPEFLDQRVIPKVFKLFKFTPEFTELRDAGLLELVIATGSGSETGSDDSVLSGRAGELRTSLKDNPPPFACHVVVYPELVHFLPRKRQSIL